MMSRKQDDPFRELMRKAFDSPDCAAATAEDEQRRRGPGRAPARHEHKRKPQAA